MCCLGAIRTQVYLTEAQRRRIDEVSQVEGLTLAEIVRRAVDSYSDREYPTADAVLAETFGADPDAPCPDCDEWARG
jgi:hypothetical protein